MKPPAEIHSILATDCGSTTTKAILIEKRGDEYRLIVRGEAPTTVEAPFDDVTVGVLNAVTEVEELAGRKLLEDGRVIIKPEKDGTGVDIYISTSSAGGGLQMLVAGVVRKMSAESAERAALGAGAIVMDVIATNDQRLPHQRIEMIRSLRPDMILISGGVDGGTTQHVAEIAEVVSAADPKPRLGAGYRLPVVYAGNKDAAHIVRENLDKKTALDVVDNLRPTLEAENLGPAREKIHDLFMEHVMAQAPGYNKLMTWTDAPIMPTPGAVGEIIQTIAREEKMNVMGVDIGGATTDVFSVFRGVFNRTVSANLGMSYSISNVLSSATVPMVARWLPFAIDESEVRNNIKNKMVRPTTIPQTLEDLMVEQALAREALRLAFIQHREFATELKGVQRQRTISDTFEQTTSGASIVNVMQLNLLVGSGGVLSHAPRRQQAALMMIDSFAPEGVTRLAVDSIFMMPQLGVLSTIHPRAAAQVFERDCLIHLGSVIAPAGPVPQLGKDVAEIELDLPGGTKKVALKGGDLHLLALTLEAAPQGIAYRVRPAKGFDAGAGSGKAIEGKVSGGVVGIILDGRGRPIHVPPDDDKRRQLLTSWFKALDLYPN